MKLWAPGLVLCLTLVGCGDGVPFNGETEGAADTSTGSIYLADDNADLTVNNVSYDANTDTLTINNIPFDDPENKYVRIPTENFANGFDAYQSDPEPGTSEFQYFAVFRRSDSGASQATAVGSNRYVSFGFGGAAAQRLGASPNLPDTGIYSYNGEYAAIRVSRPVPNGAVGIEYVTGEAEMTADFGDFDDVGAVGGVIRNRVLYDMSGQRTGTLDGFISMANGEIDRETNSIKSSTASEFIGADNTGNGNWSGVFAGPGGREIAGIVFVEGSAARETGAIVAKCVSVACQ